MIDTMIFYISLLLACGLMNLLFGAILLFLRIKATPEILTKSQRWGLSLLGILFLVNAAIIWISAAIQEGGPRFVVVIWSDMQTLSSVLILMFGLVYPRPVAGWRNLPNVLSLTAAAGVAAVGIPIALGRSSDLSLNVLQVIAWFLVPLSWFWHCRVERSAANRAILTILGWGFVLQAILDGFYIRFFSMAFPQISYFDLIRGAVAGMEYICGVATVGVVLLVLWERRGKWALAERLHIAFLMLLLTLVILDIYMGPLSWWALGPWGAIVTFVISDTWMFVRPLLLSVGLLRYQLFGTEVRGDSLLRGLMWASILGFVGALVQGFITGEGYGLRLFAALGVILVMAYPVLLAMRRMVSKLLPLSGGEAGARMSERRDAYLLGLQTAVVGGGIDDEKDERTLKNLRQKLGISDREHELLLTFFPKSGRDVKKEQIQELFLILQDGRLLAHAGKMGGDKELVAGMLSAIRGFVEEGLQGGSKELDAVKYGDYTLVMESERKVVLAALVLGPESPDVRVLLRDTLAEAMRLRGDVLEKWDGGSDKLKGLPELLAKALSGPSV